MGAYIGNDVLHINDSSQSFIIDTSQSFASVARGKFAPKVVLRVVIGILSLAGSRH